MKQRASNKAFIELLDRSAKEVDASVVSWVRANAGHLTVDQCNDLARMIAAWVKACARDAFELGVNARQIDEMDDKAA